MKDPRVGRYFSTALRVLLGAALLGAAGLKASWMIDGGAGPSGAWGTGFMSLAAIVVEAALAVALVARRQARWPLFATGALLLGFTLFLVGGEAVKPGWAVSCGCLGAVRLHFWPHVTLNAALLCVTGCALLGSAQRTDGE